VTRRVEVEENGKGGNHLGKIRRPGLGLDGCRYEHALEMLRDRNNSSERKKKINPVKEK